MTNKLSVISGLKVASSRNSSEDWLYIHIYIYIYINIYIYTYIYTKKCSPAGKEDITTPSKIKQ